MSAPSSPAPTDDLSPLEQNLAALSPGRRDFFRLVIGVTRALFVLLWPLLWAGWWVWRALGRSVAPAPSRAWLERPGHPLYVLGAGLALALGLVCTIGMCFWPFIAALWVLHTLPGAAAQGGGAESRVWLWALGAALLEAAMLAVYGRHIRAGLSGR
ncbi:hypothetical protein V3W47_16960 [Deinococcus sp. YIM 134068]|uniref:hypothetical protein n=1 Tax=Deinococcus lichenicola TaxID=3118910 RepID=UPI002F95F14C